MIRIDGDLNLLLHLLPQPMMDTGILEERNSLGLSLESLMKLMLTESKYLTD